MSFFNTLFGGKGGKERTMKATKRRRSGTSRTKENKKRKEEALERARKKRAQGRSGPLPGSAANPRKKTQAEKDARLSTNRQRASGARPTPAKPKPTPAKPKPTPAKPKPTPAKPKPTPAKKASPKKTTRFGAGSSKTVTHNGKEMANVTKEQLEKTGLTLRQYMNQWNKTGKRPR